MFDRISASFALAGSSWRVLRDNAQLLVFPVLSGLGCLLVLASFAVPLAVLPQWGQYFDANGDFHAPWWLYVVGFAYYFCNYFVVIFCNAALVSCALVQFSGERPTLADGFRAAASRLPQILAWALVSATVGLLLKLIESIHERIGYFVSLILGTAWSVITYFVVPVLVVEKLGPIDAVKRSLELLRKTWGEAVVGQIGLGFFLFLAFLPAILFFVLGGMALASNQAAVGAALLVCGFLYLLVWMAVSSALHVIFLGALYHYAACGAVPGGFDAGVLEKAFAPKK